MNIVRLSFLRREHPEIEAQAQAWVIKVDGGELSAEDNAVLGEWLSRSPLHKQLFLESARFWVDMDQLSAVVFAAEQCRSRQPTARPRRPVRRFAVAAMLLLALSGGLAWQQLGWPPVASVSAEYVTAVGQIRRIGLPDGSALSLNTDSRVEVSYDRHARLVHLLQGEAVFEVAGEPTRPFLVYAGRHAVRAVGTAFSVRTGEDSVDVKVLEGHIEVDSFDEPMAGVAGSRHALERRQAAGLPLGQGQHGIFDVREGAPVQVLAVSAAGLVQGLSWRQGMLIFDGDSLETVVEEIGRYTPARIVIADPGIRELRFGGHFRIGDIGAILATLEQDFRIKVERSNDLITLSR